MKEVLQKLLEELDRISEEIKGINEKHLGYDREAKIAKANYSQLPLC